MIFLYIFIAVLMGAGIILFLPIRILLQLDINEKKQDFRLVIYFGFIPIKIPIKTEPDKKKEKAEKKTDVHSFKDSAHQFVKKYNSAKAHVWDSLKYIQKHTGCDFFDFTIHFGTENAAKTGIMTGITWGAGSLLLKIMEQMIGIKKLGMNVHPDFTKECFKLHILCILRIQTVHIINIITKIFKVINVFTTEEVVP